MRIALENGFYKAKSIVASAQREINLYPEKNPGDSPVPVTHYPTSGLRLLAGIPLVTPPTPPPSPANIIWAVTTSCKFLPFDATATGDTAPLIPLTADNPTDPPSADLTKTLFDMDVDSSGNQYMLRLVRLEDASTYFEIDVYAPGTTGSPASFLRQIFGPLNTNFNLFGNTAWGGLCLDTSETYIYTCNHSVILRFPIDASGDATSTVLVNTSGVIFTRIYYDNPRSLLWVSLGGGDGAGIRAYDLDGNLVRNITCSEFWSPSTNIDSVAIDANGVIYGIVGVQLDDNAQFAAIVYVFDADADGDSVPVRRLQCELSGSPSTVDVDRLSGNVYIGVQSGLTPNSHIYSVPNVDGIYTSAQFLTDLAGDTTLLDYDFGVSEVTDAIQQIRIIYHYP